MLPYMHRIYIDICDMDIGIAANVADVVHPTVLEDEMLGALPPTTASLLLPRV